MFRYEQQDVSPAATCALIIFTFIFQNLRDVGIFVIIYKGILWRPLEVLFNCLSGGVSSWLAGRG